MQTSIVVEVPCLLFFVVECLTTEAGEGPGKEASGVPGHQVAT